MTSKHKTPKTTIRQSVDHKKPMTRWTVHVYITEDGYVESSYVVWADSLEAAKGVENECMGLLHRSEHCRCISHSCKRCADKEIGQEVIEECKDA